MADLYVAESGIHGAGVFAAREFAAGETVLVLDDSRVVDEGHPLREPALPRSVAAGSEPVVLRNV